MKRSTRYGAVAVVLLMSAGLASPSLGADVLQPPAEIAPQASGDELTDAEIRDLLVQESIARYTGSCACPYHRKWNEKLFLFPNRFRDHPTVLCGADSEYLRPGGPTVFCYGSDVPAEMVEAYREHLKSTLLTEPIPEY